MNQVLVINKTDQIIENKLQKHNVTQAVINELKERYLSLKIKNLDDKEGIKLAREAKSNIRSVRTLAVKICKEGRAAANAEQKAWIAKEKEVVGEVDQVESHIDNELDIIEQEKLRIQQEADHKAKEILMKRVSILLDLGFIYNGVEYRLEDLSINEVQVRQYPNDNFNEFTRQAMVIFQRIQKENAEKARLKQEENDRLAAEKTRLDELAKQQAEREAALKAESDRLEAEKRRIELANAKAEATRVANAKAESDRLAQVELQKQHAIKVEADRVANEIRLKADAEARIAQAKIDTENRLKKEQQDKLESERLEKLELERKAALQPDKEKLIMLIGKLQLLEMPEVTSIEAQNTITMVKELIGKIQKYINDKAQSM